MAPRFRPARIRSLSITAETTANTNLPFLAPAAATTTALKMPASVLQGQNVTLQATVTATTGIPAGTVTFEDGSTTLGSAPLLDGKRKHLA